MADTHARKVYIARKLKEGRGKKRRKYSGLFEGPAWGQRKFAIAVSRSVRQDKAHKRAVNRKQAAAAAKEGVAAPARGLFGFRK